MQPDPNRYDDDPDDDLEEQADEGDAADAWADDEATAAPVSGCKTLGGALGAALDNLEKTLAGKGIDISHIPERRDMEEEKPEPLPLVDEEELAAIKDPRERARQRYNNCLLYTSPSPRDGLLSRMPSSA